MMLARPVLLAAPLGDALPDLRRMVEAGASMSEDARALSERDRDYYDGKQWSDTELAVLRRRRQPPTVDNCIKPKVDGMVGIEQRGRVDPRAYPREPGDEDAAERCMSMRSRPST